MNYYLVNKTEFLFGNGMELMVYYFVTSKELLSYVTRMHGLHL